MSDLEETHPDVHQKFLDGFHVIRRSNQCWARLSSDLVIEQTLMRSLKSIGGLTHGSGMLVHAYSGCDSTSRIFGIGKKAVFHKLLKSDPVMNSCASTFILGNNSSDDISDLGKGLMISLFGSKPDDTLSSLHLVAFSKKEATAKVFVTPERLRPTLPATSFHSQQVYFQTTVWMGMANEMNPIEWGWKMESDELIPVMTDKNAAPDKILKVIHCNCSGDANLLNAAADVMDSPALLLVDLAKLISVTIQTTLKRLSLKRRRRMTFKTEGELNLFYGKMYFCMVIVNS